MHYAQNSPLSKKGGADGLTQPPFVRNGKLRVKCPTIIQQERSAFVAAFLYSSVTTFEFYRFRFHFRARDAVHFPRGTSANVVRGAFGTLLRQSAAPADYARLFEPGKVLGKSPSGLADWPRPLVFRAYHLDGTFPPDACFFLDVHVFDLRAPVLPLLRKAFGQLARCGIGPARGRADLERVEQLDLAGKPTEVGDVPETPARLNLDSSGGAASRLIVRFLTPTELKAGGTTVDRPEFGVLFGRLRDRISTLGSFYGAGPLPIDFRGLGERADAIELTRADLKWERLVRRSGRTGQVHPLGGFTGEAEYRGAAAEFLPWLDAGYWVGVGRHTVWGKGVVRAAPAGMPDVMLDR
jgi:hypothetical protein